MFVNVPFRTIFASAFVRLGKKLSQLGGNGVGDMFWPRVKVFCTSLFYQFRNSRGSNID